MDEIRDGLAEPLQRREHFDDVYGRGGWRPLPRGCVWQNDKWRPIDDGRRARTNPLSAVSEAVVCAPAELLVAVVRALVAAFMAVLGYLPSWFSIRMFVEDWWKGYRQLFPSARDKPFTIVAIQVPTTGEWLFSQLLGLPFGLGAAVNQFARPAALLTAMARRWLFLLIGNYVDDSGAVDLELIAESAQLVFIELAEAMGVRLSTSKRRRAAAVGDFLGHAHDFSSVRTDAAVGFGPKLGLRERILAELETVLDQGRLKSGHAAKLRGLLTWLDSCFHGRPCRGALSAFIARQYYEDLISMTPNLEASICFLMAAVRWHQDRTIPVVPRRRPLALVYTDASDEGGVVRVGALVVDPSGRGHALVYDVPASLRDEWGTTTVINQAELYAGPLTAWSMPELLRRHDVLWLIDNTSAESALVKAGSPTESMCRLALTATAALAGLDARPWFEHVASPDNPADVLSRAGLRDPLVMGRVASGEWLVHVAVPPPAESMLDYEFWWQR